MNYILLFVVAVASLNVAFFFFSPHVFSLNFGIQDAPAVLLFQFSHFNFEHLLENLLGLIFTAALAIELEMKTEDFLFAYFVGIFIVLPLLFAFPGVTIAGNSTGIFGALAAALLKARKLVPVQMTYPLAVLFIFSSSLTSAISGSFALSFLKGDIFHFSGFLAGAGISISTYKNRIKSRVYK